MPTHAWREKFELSSKYSVYKGVSQLKGAQGELWLGIAVVAPSAKTGTFSWPEKAVASLSVKLIAT